MFVLHIQGGEIDQVVVLQEGVTTIGRTDATDITLPHHFVSSRHAQLEVVDDACILTDLGSTNGTSINDQPIAPNLPIALSESMTVVIGPYSLVVRERPEQEEVKPEPVQEKEEPAPVVPKKEPEPEAKPEPKKPVEPPSEPPKPPRPPVRVNGSQSSEPDFSKPPVGLRIHSERLLNYLPGIYHTDFMARFLGIFESILTPIEWTVDNFDLYLHAQTAPAGFLPWLAQWYDIAFDATWDERQRRDLLTHAYEIFALRGTKKALSQVLEIYTGRSPEIIDLDDDDNPFSFTVRLPVTRAEIDPEIIEQIIEQSKPAHTTYKLFYKRR